MGEFDDSVATAPTSAPAGEFDDSVAAPGSHYRYPSAVAYPGLPKGYSYGDVHAAALYDPNAAPGQADTVKASMAGDADAYRTLTAKYRMLDPSRDNSAFTDYNTTTGLVGGLSQALAHGKAQAYQLAQDLPAAGALDPFNVIADPQAAANAAQGSPELDEGKAAAQAQEAAQAQANARSVSPTAGQAPYIASGAGMLQYASPVTGGVGAFADARLQGKGPLESFADSVVAIGGGRVVKPFEAIPAVGKPLAGAAYGELMNQEQGATARLDAQKPTGEFDDSLLQASAQAGDIGGNAANDALMAAMHSAHGGAPEAAPRPTTDWKSPVETSPVQVETPVEGRTQGQQAKDSEVALLVAKGVPQAEAESMWASERAAKLKELQRGEDAATVEQHRQEMTGPDTTKGLPTGKLRLADEPPEAAAKPDLPPDTEGIGAGDTQVALDRVTDADAPTQPVGEFDDSLVNEGPRPDTADVDDVTMTQRTLAPVTGGVRLEPTEGGPNAEQGRDVRVREPEAASPEQLQDQLRQGRGRPGDVEGVEAGGSGDRETQDEGPRPDEGAVNERRSEDQNDANGAQAPADGLRQPADERPGSAASPEPQLNAASDRAGADAQLDGPVRQAQGAVAGDFKPLGPRIAGKDRKLLPGEVAALKKWAYQRIASGQLKLRDGKNVPYGMGMDGEGVNLLADPAFLKERTRTLTAGRKYDAVDPTVVHEVVENELRKQGWSYKSDTGAHEAADQVEDAHLRDAGFTAAEIKEHNEVEKPVLRDSEKWTGQPDPRLDTGPYQEMGDTDLLKPPGERGGKGEAARAESSTPEKPPPTVKPHSAVTGEPATFEGFRGEGKPKSEVYNYSDEPALGKGQYLAFTQDDAANYGDKISPQKVSLQNPLVIRSDAQWRNLTKAAGWKYPNPFGLERAEVNTYGEKLRAEVERRGHDGLVTLTSDGDDTKTLRNIVGHDQVVAYKEGKAADAKDTGPGQAGGGEPPPEPPASGGGRGGAPPEPPASGGAAPEPAPEPKGKQQEPGVRANKRPDLAIQSSLPAARDAEVRDIINSHAPEERAGAQNMADAHDMLEKDYDGTRQKIQERMDRGEPLKDVEKAAQRIIADDLYGKWQEIQDRTDRNSPESLEAEAAWRKWGEDDRANGTAAGRALQARKDAIDTPEGRLQDARYLASRATPEMAKPFQKLRLDLEDTKRRQEEAQVAGRPDEVKRLGKIRAQIEAKIDALRKAQGARFDDVKARLKEFGFDLDDPDAEWLKDPAQYRNFLMALDSAGAGLGAVANELYIAALHASLVLPGVKIASDVSQSILHNAVIRPLEALVSGRSTAGREVLAAWRAYIPAVFEGGRNGLQALRTERNVFPGGDAAHAAQQELQHYPVIRGALGRVVRQASLLPFVRAADSMFKTIAARTEVAARAERSAVDADGKRLTGDALDAHFRKELSDFASGSWQKAFEHANEATFTERPVRAVNALNRFKYTPVEGIGGKSLQFGARALFPFTTIPTNILTQMMKKGVPGLSDLYAVTKAIAAAKDGDFRSTMSLELAHAAVRWGMVAGATSLLQSDAIHGNDEKWDNNPHSIKIFGQWRDMSRIGWIGRAMATLADYAKGGAPSVARGWVYPQSGEGMLAKEALVKPFVDLYHLAITPLAEAKSFPVRGEAPGATVGENYKAAAAKYAAAHIPIPSFEPQIARAPSDAVPDTIAQQKALRGQPFTSQFATHVGAKVGVPADQPPAMRGVSKERDASDIGTLLDRLLSPMALGTEGQEPPKPRGGHRR